MSLFESASLVCTPNGTKAGKLYSIKPTDGSGDLSVTRATTATRVNSSGLIESVSANVPRLDYSNGSCPSILVEPQRTNLVTYSEDFTNISWSKLNLTIVNNSTTSPSGILNGNKLTITSTGVTGLYKEIVSIIGNRYFLSVYVKKAETQYVNLGFIYSAGIYSATQFDLNSGTVNTIRSSVYTDANSSITNVGNGWFRITHSCIINTATAYPTILPSNAEWTSGEPRQNLIGNNTTGAYFWGLQMELGSYATSYISTTSASVTRNADVISKTGISSLIGQTEGTLFIDVLPNNTLSVNVPIRLDDTTSSNRIQFEWSGATTANLLIASGGSWSVLATGLSVPQNIHSKIAIAYKINDFVLYVNGTQKVNDTSGTVPVGMSSIRFNESSSTVFSGYYKTAALWKTRLSNSELVTLTTI